eukprot:CAMPEP_0179174748 /NCGR_PEP_ID=MMETSP0796-20121207/86284_1 /TAXON_ID=73915 /ORGANISM="Pyrodinium bahamense, Strain pbaha01" /LENGTH=293 /DNA_ID=CAMNT_0020878057 /DNA_START=271 /DNA_END=1154 /DNA_ORIENTATION=+
MASLVASARRCAASERMLLELPHTARWPLLAARCLALLRLQNHELLPLHHPNQDSSAQESSGREEPTNKVVLGRDLYHPQVQIWPEGHSAQHQQNIPLIAAARGYAVDRHQPKHDSGSDQIVDYAGPNDDGPVVHTADQVRGVARHQGTHHPKCYGYSLKPRQNVPQHLLIQGVSVEPSHQDGNDEGQRANARASDLQLHLLVSAPVNALWNRDVHEKPYLGRSHQVDPNDAENNHLPRFALNLAPPRAGQEALAAEPLLVLFYRKADVTRTAERPLWFFRVIETHFAAALGR